MSQGSQDRHGWHGEAFFERVLGDNRRVVHLRGAFVAATGSGMGRRAPITVGRSQWVGISRRIEETELARAE